MDDLPLFRPDLMKLIRDSLADGGWKKRSHIVRDIHAALQARGMSHSRSSLTAAVKKCLPNMKTSGEIEGGLEDGTFAHYRLKPSAAAAATTADDTPQATYSPGMVAPAKVIGRGSGSVYCYYYEADRVHAKSEDRVCWPCKIGMASRDSSGRLRDQGALTARSAPAVWALEIKTDDAEGLERTIHRVLRMVDRETTGGGAEWFLTSPAMVEAIFLQLEAIRMWPE